MTHSRRRVMRLAGLLALPATAALVLAGCSGSGSGDAGSGDGKSFTFTFATSNNLESPYESLAKEYMEQHEGVTITTNPTPNDKYGETIRTQLQAGNASDVIQTTPGSGDARSILPLAEAGFLEPLELEQVLLRLGMTELDDFLGRTLALVPFGSEPDHVDLDALVTDLLS